MRACVYACTHACVCKPAAAFAPLAAAPPTPVLASAAPPPVLQHACPVPGGRVPCDHAVGHVRRRVEFVRLLMRVSASHDTAMRACYDAWRS